MTYLTFKVSRNKRLYMPKAKSGQVKVAFGKEPGNSPDLLYCYGGHGAKKGDSLTVLHFFAEIKNDEGKSMLQELQERGYDLTTLKFSVQKEEKNEP